MGDEVWEELDRLAQDIASLQRQHDQLRDLVEDVLVAIANATEQERVSAELFANIMKEMLSDSQ